MNLFELLQEPFVRYAIYVSILLAVSAALIGVPLVLKRYSLIGTGLSNVAFAGMALAAVINISNDLIIVIPLTITVAILLLATDRNAKIKGDASIAMISVGALAFGYFLSNAFPVFYFPSDDIAAVLFGNTARMVTLTAGDVMLSLGLTVLVVGFYVLFYNKIFATTFDPDFAKATGTRVKIYEVLIAIVIAIVVSLAMRLVGPLLTAALIIFPALSAMRVFKDFKMVCICSAIISVVCSAFGMITAIMWDGAPVGATIVLANIIVFAVFFGTGYVLKRK